MGVYLPNVDLPKDDKVLTVQICPDGSIWQQYRGTVPNAKAVPVPPHGRLIDADALTEKLKKHREYHSDGSNSGAAISNGIGQCLDIINGRECPTIIEAEEGDDG